MNRRGFLGGILAAGMAPMVVSAGVLMPVRSIIVPLPIMWGDGIHDDSAAFQALIDGRPVERRDGIATEIDQSAGPAILLAAAGHYSVANLIIPSGGLRLLDESRHNFIRLGDKPFARSPAASSSSRRLR
jgi:hypothetical protein